MRNYARAGSRGGGARAANRNLAVTASLGAGHRKHVTKIEDDQSDIDDSDDTGAPQDFHSSGDGSTASDMSYENHIGTEEWPDICQEGNLTIIDLFGPLWN